MTKCNKYAKGFRLTPEKSHRPKHSKPEGFMIRPFLRILKQEKPDCPEKQSYYIFYSTKPSTNSNT